MTFTNTQNKPLFEMDTQYVFYAYTATRGEKIWKNMKIHITFTKKTKHFIHYHYRQTEGYKNHITTYPDPDDIPRIEHPVIYTKSKIVVDEDKHFKFYIRNKNYENYKILVSFMNYDDDMDSFATIYCDYETNSSYRLRRDTHYKSVRMLYHRENNFDFRPERYVVMSDIRRYVKNLRKRLDAKKLIVAYWCRARYNPEYKIGRRYCMDNYYEDILGIPPPPNQPLPPIPVY